MVKAQKKLIEVALPLDDINEAATHEKRVRQGHPTNIHRWWARRPFAAARAILFSQLVNDPGGDRGWGAYKGQTKEEVQLERERLFKIVRGLALWDNPDEAMVLREARQYIKESMPHEVENISDLVFSDPFSGGGTIPFEAYRLGMTVCSSDLNPVSVLINKSLTEIPVRFLNRNPISLKNIQLAQTHFKGTEGIVEDIKCYGAVLQNLVAKDHAHLYQSIKMTKDIISKRVDLARYEGEELTPIAYVWARTVKSPNPAFSGVFVPLIKSFVLNSKKGKESYLEPCLDGDRYSFVVRHGKIPEWANDGTKLSRGANFQCILSKSPIDSEYIKEQGRLGRLGSVLLAVVAEGKRERVYLDPSLCSIENNITPSWSPVIKMPTHPQYVGVFGYGYDTYDKLFSDRQLAVLSCYCESLSIVHKVIARDAAVAGYANDEKRFDEGGGGAVAYADAVVTYLALAVSKFTDSYNMFCPWEPVAQCARQLFGRQAYTMIWDYAEVNPFSQSSGSFLVTLNGVCKGVASLDLAHSTGSQVTFAMSDAATIDLDTKCIFSTDPPYYDNVPYSDLADFFYIWLRKMLSDYYPSLFATVVTPKMQEIVADYKRFGGRDSANIHFAEKLKNALSAINRNARNEYPVTIYYAFKSSGTDNDGTSSLGWESFLEAVIKSNFQITGTWPLRTENTAALKHVKNSLASSIVLVCRKRKNESLNIPRREFLRELKEELPGALEAMIGGKKGSSPIAPVDLAQAAIGPGMAVYSRYSGIIEADGSMMSVHDALIQINKVIDDFFYEAEGDMDSDTRFCIEWFMQYGFKTSEYGQADILSKAKGTSVDGLVQAGVLDSGVGKVRLLKFEEYPADWDPEKDTRTPVWEALHQLICALRSGGETKAGLLLQKMADRTESIRQLAYRLYTLCERKGWAEEARAYNELIASWHGTIEAAERVHSTSKIPQQIKMEF